MFSFPRVSHYATICTEEMWKAHPGAVPWRYDGQFIWIVKE